MQELKQAFSRQTDCVVGMSNRVRFVTGVEAGGLALRLEELDGEGKVFSALLASTAKLVHLYGTLLYYLTLFQYLIFRNEREKLKAQVDAVLQKMELEGRLFEEEARKIRLVVEQSLTSEEEGLVEAGAMDLLRGELCEYAAADDRRSGFCVRIFPVAAASDHIKVILRIEGDGGSGISFSLDIGRMEGLAEAIRSTLSGRQNLAFTLCEFDGLRVSVACGDGIKLHVDTQFGAVYYEVREIGNLGAISFWARRALLFRGNRLLKFGSERYGFTLGMGWGERDPRPRMRFYIGDGLEREHLNLSRLNLATLELFTRLAIGRKLAASGGPVNSRSAG